MVTMARAAVGAERAEQVLLDLATAASTSPRSPTCGVMPQGARAIPAGRVALVELVVVEAAETGVVFGAGGAATTMPAAVVGLAAAAARSVGVAAPEVV